MKKVSFQEFVKEVLKNAVYKKGKDADCIVAIAPDLPGCITLETWTRSRIGLGKRLIVVGCASIGFPKVGFRPRL
ncbi:MAG: hypothetical protein AAB209_13585 [Bacteroidota bacterium]